jgi:hypothetical protein
LAGEDWVRNHLTLSIGNNASFSTVSTGIKLLGRGSIGWTWLDIGMIAGSVVLAAFTSLPSVFLIPHGKVCGLLGSAPTASARASSFSLE